MKYNDVVSSFPPVDEFARSEIETLYSFGHYDGVGIGLVRFRGKLCWAERWDTETHLYWLVELKEDHGERLLKRGEEWRRLFSSGMSWAPNGEKLPYVPGEHCTTEQGLSEEERTRREAFYRQWHAEHPLEVPPLDAQVIGFFRDWALFRDWSWAERRLTTLT